jgi:drug/metabolite transporter (DMT)-like permease
MNLKTQSLLLIFLCSLCWGPSYLFIKIALPDIPPLTLVLLRVGIAAAILLFVCLIQRQKLLLWTHAWKHFLIMGLTLNAFPFLLISYGEVFIPSSLAGILNSFTLICTAVIAHFFGKHDPITKNKMFGIISGIVGLCFIYLPLLFHERIDNFFGALLCLCACISYGIGTVYVRSHLHEVPSIIALTFQLIFATIFLLPFSLIIDQPFHLPVPPYQAIIGAFGLALIGTVAGYLMFYKAIKLAGATYASLSVLLIPIFAIILGVIFLHEQLTWNIYVGTLCILIGVIGVNPSALSKLTSDK